MNELTISLLSNSSGFDPGSVVDVRLSWTYDQTPDSIEVRLVWNTAGKGDRDLRIVKLKEIRPNSRQGSEVVSFDLPWGPYSFSGKLISIIWAIEAVALPGQESARRELTMGPNGREVVVTGKSD